MNSMTFFRNEVAGKPANIPPFNIDFDKEICELPINHTPLRPMGTGKGKTVFDSVTDMLKTGVGRRKSLIKFLRY